MGADLILHVIDASSDEREAQIQSVEEVLGQIGAHDIKRVEVFNKIDLLGEVEKEALSNRHPDAILVSALSGAGIDALVKRIAAVASAHDELISVLVPYSRGDLVSIGEDGTRIDMQIGPAYASMFEAFRVEVQSPIDA